MQKLPRPTCLFNNVLQANDNKSLYSYRPTLFKLRAIPITRVFIFFRKWTTKKIRRYFEKLRLDPERLVAHQEKERQRIKAIRTKERDLLEGRPDILENKRIVETLRKQK